MSLEFKNFYKNKSVLVTGATGFKGAWLCFWLNMLGAKFQELDLTQIRIKISFTNLSCKKE